MAEEKGMMVVRKGSKLTITVLLDEKGKPSSTGKSTILYSSGGFQWPEGAGVGISINVIKSKRA